MRALLHLATVLLGAAVGVAAVAVHRMGPVGIVLALATTFAVAWSLWLVPAPRRLPTSYAAGWLLPVLLVVLGRPEGDFAVAGDLVGYTLMGGALVLVLVGVVGGPTTRRDSGVEAGRGRGDSGSGAPRT